MATYHADFWVAVATVAPVVALGHLFAITSGMKHGFLEYIDTRANAWQTLRHNWKYGSINPSIRLTVVGGANVLLGAYVLLGSLRSLADEQNRISVGFAAWAEALSLLFACYEAVSVATVKRQAEEACRVSGLR